MATEVQNVASVSSDRQDMVRRFVESITREERMLVVLKRELYDGQWSEMEADLRARLEGKPYIFKMVHRIEDDLARIVRLRQFEADYQVDLSDYVNWEPQRPAGPPDAGAE